MRSLFKGERSCRGVGTGSNRKSPLIVCDAVEGGGTMAHRLFLSLAEPIGLSPQRGPRATATPGGDGAKQRKVTGATRVQALLPLDAASFGCSADGPQWASEENDWVNLPQRGRVRRLDDPTPPSTAGRQKKYSEGRAGLRPSGRLLAPLVPEGASGPCVHFGDLEAHTAADQQISLFGLVSRSRPSVQGGEAASFGSGSNAFQPIV